MEDTTFFHMITISPKRNKPHFSFLVAELPSSKAPPTTMATSTSFLSLTSLSRAPSPPSSPSAPIYKPLTSPPTSSLAPSSRFVVPTQSLRPQSPCQPPLRRHPTTIGLLVRLSGLIQQQLGLLVRLSVFDVSNNKLSGLNLPSLGNRSGNLARFNASSYAGNKGLYGYPLPPMKSSGLSVLAIIGIAIGCGPLNLVLSFTAVCIWLRTTEKKSDNDEGKISQLIMPNYCDGAEAPC
ncbi:hypothetical protein OROHE_021561 [Orobanche hederae]